MNGIAVLRASLESSRKMIEWIVSDFSDADLLVRPVPEANHMAWQLGHLIAAERLIVPGQIPDAKSPELPEGFETAHSKETESSNDPNGFLSKTAYVALPGNMREATLVELEKLTDADLDRTTQGNLASFCPTLGAVIGLLSDHIMMHLGQATVVRRELGKPVLF